MEKKSLCGNVEELSLLNFNLCRDWDVKYGEGMGEKHRKDEFM
jgi:hypothetical protein